MAKSKTKKFTFGLKETTVVLEGNEFTFRALTVRELEGLVKSHEDLPEEALTAALIVAGETSGLLEGYGEEDFGAWPAAHFRKVQSAVSELNGLGETGSGN